MTRASDHSDRVVRFGVFQVDLDARDLYRRGLRVKLQQKPFQILELLLERPGELVTRKEIADRLWPGTYVNFERSLNTAVNALRQALGDSPRNSRFVETRPGLGYRFIAAVEQVSTRARSAPAANNSQVNIAAYQDYLKGRHFADKMSPDSLRFSVAYYESALAADPRYAPALAGMAETYLVAALLGTMPPGEALARAGECAKAALQIDDMLAESHASLGAVMQLQDWNWAGAEAQYLKARDLNPNSAPARQWYADYLCAMGRMDEALSEIRRAQELQPLSLTINMKLAWTQFLARDFEGAREQSWKTLAIEPGFAPAQHTLGLAYEHLGEYEEAAIELRNAYVCSGGHPIAAAALGHVYANAGKEQDARKILGELRELSATRPVSPYWTSLIHAALGDTATALSELANGIRMRDIWMPWVGADPRFDSLRNDQRSAALIPNRAAGL